MDPFHPEALLHSHQSQIQKCQNKSVMVSVALIAVCHQASSAEDGSAFEVFVLHPSGVFSGESSSVLRPDQTQALRSSPLKPGLQTLACILPLSLPCPCSQDVSLLV